MRTWVRPMAVEENYTANQTVADSVNPCYTLYCMVAGDGKGEFREDTTFGRDVNWMGTTVKHDGKLHGEPCAKGSSMNSKTGQYYEYHKASATGTINVGASVGSNRYYATWTSKDVNGTGTYQHYGYAVLDGNYGPNHS